jgi:hypothetical protein
MSNHDQPPDGTRLRSLLRESWPNRPLPPRFPESVWQRIDQTEAAALLQPSPLAWLDRWIERLLLPRFALGALVLLLAAGGLTGVIHGTVQAKQQAQERYLSAIAPNTLR